MIALLLTLLASAPLDVPFVAQGKDTCAAAALTMVMRFWGVPADQDAIARELLEPELRGIRGSALESFARKRGMLAVAHAGDLAQLRDYVGKGRPMIVTLDAGRDRFHDVVVIGFDDTAAVVHDPAEGAARKVKLDAFEKRWSRAGHFALLVLPAPSAQ